MKIFPTKRLEFRLVGDQEESLRRLARRTEKSKILSSNYTDRSFRGDVEGNRFRLISATIGKGAFCVISGEIEYGSGYVDVEIQKVFRILLSIFLLFPAVAFFVLVVSQEGTSLPIMFLVAIGQMLMIRFVFIGLVFHFLSKDSLSRLRDVLDFEWVNN